LKNKEYLVQLLLELRSNGISNHSLLKAIELFPPHYFLYLMGYKKPTNKINFQELIAVVKLFDIAFSNNKKIENIFIIGIKKGWTLILASKLAKRIYSLCEDNQKKLFIDNFCKTHSFANIYLKVGKDIVSWKPVAPFDVIISFAVNSFFAKNIDNYLSNNGIALIPKTKENNVIKISKLKKTFESNLIDINFSLINKCDLV